MLRKTLLFTILVLLCAPAAAQEDLLYQWASYAVATSEYSTNDWSAQQATGEPDTTGCMDAKTAWASAGLKNPNETLTVYFDTPVFPTQVNIYQSYNPGTITGIDLLTAADNTPITVKNSASTSTTCPNVFTINITWENPLPILGVAIRLDQTQATDWTEIDAVQLVGVPVDDDTDSDEYEIVGDPGLSITCQDGSSFTNGVEVRVIQMRSGFNYTATAIGINGFDPVLAVLDSSGRGLCTDDDGRAAAYSAWLPTTGEIAPSRLSSQITFANNSPSPFADISLIVGGLNNATGEFLLILEGMALTSNDGAGDAFAVQITPGMIASKIAPTVYMISVTNNFDPLIALIDADYNFRLDTSKNYIACDNAGYNTCWGESYEMTGYYVSRTQQRTLGGGSYDAMLRIPLREDDAWLFYNFLMRSSGMRTYGDYIVAFHIGIGA